MIKETLEKLYKERTLLKQLYSIDHEKYAILLPRIQEIKMIINSDYAPNSYSEATFALWNLELSAKITDTANELLQQYIQS